MSTIVITATRVGDRDRSSAYTVLSIAAIALLLRIYSISLYPLSGDEYDTLDNVERGVLNWNSFIYSGLMHFWTRLGSSELWLRLPATIFGVTTVVILFKIGERLGGWRTAVVTGLLAATSPFNIYHSQEVRFYSFFMCASAAFMLATLWSFKSKRSFTARATRLMSGLVLVFAHFLGILALYAQCGAAILAVNSRWSRRKLTLAVIGLPIIGFTLLQLPFVQHKLWELVQGFGHGTGSATPVVTRVSLMNLVKLAFAGYTFVFGYHVYPLRLVVVIAGVVLTVFLILTGIVRMWRETRWVTMIFTYALMVVGVYLVLDSVGGRIASGAAPRHVAFAWPIFVVVTAMGVTWFKRPLVYFLVAGLLSVNAVSVWAGWQKDWTYGISTDYRSAAEHAGHWIKSDTAVLHDGRSQGPVMFYFPQSVLRIGAWPYLQGGDLNELRPYERLILVTDDWEPERRRGFDQLMGRLNERYAAVDGHVDYPLFEYSLDRKSSSESAGYIMRGESNQVLQPISFYGLEFQDLRLPVAVKVKNVSLNVIGAYGLPDSENRRELSLPLSATVNTQRVILLTDIVGAGGLQPDQLIAEVLVENKTGTTVTIPLHLGKETAGWDQQCESSAPCQTVFQWHKRLAISGQNGYEGVLRDFSAGLHGVVLDLPKQQEVVRLTLSYTANSGRLYVWGIALPAK